MFSERFNVPFNSNCGVMFTYSSQVMANKVRNSVVVVWSDKGFQPLFATLRHALCWQVTPASSHVQAIDWAIVWLFPFGEQSSSNQSVPFTG